MQAGNMMGIVNVSQRFLASIVLVLALSCSDTEARKALTIKGSTTVLPVVQIGAEVFMERHPGVDISVQGGGSGVGIASLIDGTTHIATSSRKIKKGETARAEAAGVHPFETIVANNPELKVERTAEGETVFMSPTGGESGVQNAEITLQVGLWARTHGGIAFDSSTLFRLPNGALRSPDVSWIQTERWQSLTSKQRKTYPPITPDFVIELRSPSDRLSDVKEKMTEYAACGVRLGWLIDPLLKQVHIYKPDQTPVMMQDPKSVADETVLPGFVLDLSRIFV